MHGQPKLKCLVGLCPKRDSDSVQQGGQLITCKKAFRLYFVLTCTPSIRVDGIRTLWTSTRIGGTQPLSLHPIPIRIDGKFKIKKTER
jgi:hypothetical protein